jgi:hypothetical protein
MIEHDKHMRGRCNMCHRPISESGNIYVALCAIMEDAQPLAKDGRNTTQGFNFRGIDAVMNHLHPLFARHQVVVMPDVIAERSEERETKSGGRLIYRVLTVRFTFVHVDGSRAGCTVIGEGMDAGDKAANKAMAVALKYALTQMLLLPYDEVDPDVDSHPTSLPKPSIPAKPSTPSKPVGTVATGKEMVGDHSQNAVVLIGKVYKKEGESEQGPWRLWKFEVGEDRYSTFDVKIGEQIDVLEGQQVSVFFAEKQTKKGIVRDIVAISPYPTQEAEQQNEALPF